MRLFRTENRSSVQTSSWLATVSTPSFAFLTFHNYMPNYPLLGGPVCMAASKLSRSKQADCLFFLIFFLRGAGGQEDVWTGSEMENVGYLHVLTAACYRASVRLTQSLTMKLKTATRETSEGRNILFYLSKSIKLNYKWKLCIWNVLK